MVSAWEGDPATWGRVNRALRDALADHAVRRCAYYRKAVPAAGGFRDIPILTREIIGEHLDDLLAEGVPEERRIPKRTSGSTGEPAFFYRDSTQGPMEYISAQRFLKRLHGISEEMTIVWMATAPPLRLPDDPRPPRGALFRGRLRRGRFAVLPVSVRGLTGDRLRREMARWRRLGPYVLYAYASTAARIVEEVAEGRAALPVRPEAVVTTGDTLGEEAAGRISQVLGCPVHSWYGSNELNGYLAGTIPGTRRYAFNPLLAHVEIVDDGGLPVRPGELGRLIVTDLNNHVMPFLRYDTGDVAMESAERWRGGWRVIESLAGRSPEVLRLAGDRVLTQMLVGQSLFRLADFQPHIRFYQCVQTGPDELTLRVVWRRPPSEELRRGAAEALRAVTGPTTAVRVEDIAELDRLPSGKAWVLRRDW